MRWNYLLLGSALFVTIVGSCGGGESKGDIDGGGAKFTIGGLVTGLRGKVVVTNGADELTIEADGAFAFPTKVADGGTYMVQVSTQPSGQSCAVANGSGTASGADVTNISVDCLSSNADLSDLAISVGDLSPTFSADVTTYATTVLLTSESIRVTATALHPDAAIVVNGIDVDSGAMSPAIPLDLGQTTISIVVTTPNDDVRTYRIDMTRGKSEYVKASNTDASDWFGYAVALSGDTLAVGVRYESSNATGVGGDQTNNAATKSGAVYVFTRSGATWAQQAYIKASNTDADDYFGISVALSGDTLVVGAQYEDSNATGVGGDQTNNSASNSGAAYVFTRTGVTWSQEAYIKASNADASDYFGNSVALSGDTLVVGAQNEDSDAAGVGGDQSNNSTNTSGAVYVFTRSGTTWTQQEYVKASDGGSNDLFGHSVALSGDTLAVGAVYEDSNATGVDGDDSDNTVPNSGAVYVFTRSGATWTQQAYIKAANAEADDRFGGKVALSDDTLAVGARHEDSNATGVGGDDSDNTVANSGAVYVFTRSGATWTQQAYIKAANTDTDDWFGDAVALDGDALVVGARQESSDATGVGGDGSNNAVALSGAVYVFTRSGTMWSQLAYVKASNAGAGDLFGFSVAVSGDTLAVGAFGEGSNATGVGGDETNNSSNSSGAVYIIR